MKKKINAKDLLLEAGRWPLGEVFAKVHATSPELRIHRKHEWVEFVQVSICTGGIYAIVYMRGIYIYTRMEIILSKNFPHEKIKSVSVV